MVLFSYQNQSWMKKNVVNNSGKKKKIKYLLSVGCYFKTDQNLQTEINYNRTAQFPLALLSAGADALPILKAFLHPFFIAKYRAQMSSQVCNTSTAF